MGSGENEVGIEVGLWGCRVGIEVGFWGWLVGMLGAADGTRVGNSLGFADGNAVGAPDGKKLGLGETFSML